MLMLTQKLFGLIPNSYPISCEDGWALEVNENETRINCTNDLCPIDGALRLDKALDLLEIPVNVGSISALKITLILGLEYHMDIFNRLGLINLNNADIETAIKTHLTTIKDYMDKKTPISLNRFMECWCFEQLGTISCQKIFSDLDNLEEFYEITSHDKLAMHEYVGDKLSISPYCTTVNLIVKFMKTNKHRLLETASNFVFKPKKSGCITVTITGEITARREDGTAYKPRQKFIEEMADKYNINIQYSNHITQTLDYLICDTENGHTKINKVKNNPSFSHIKLVTSKEFEELLKPAKEGQITGF